MPTYYTHIETGAPANANTFNEPMDELDAAIVARQAAIAAEATARGAADDALDTRIDNIVADTGDDIVEVVDARGAGNVGSAATSLAERIEWLEGAQNVYAAAYGFHDGATAAANLTALNAACDAAAAFAAPCVVWLPAGRFSLNNFTLDAGVVLRGARMPVHDRSGGELVGGTVLVGGVVTLSDQSGLMDLGIEQATSGTSNCITGNTADDCILINVATLGNATADPNKTAHGCVFTNGARNLISNFYVAECTHGLIIKGAHNRVYNLSTWNVGTILGLYGDAGQDCEHNQIIGVKADGTAAGDGGAIWFNAFDAHSVQNNLIANINLHNTTFGIYMTSSLASGYLCQDNCVMGGVIHTASITGVYIDASGDIADNGPDYNDFSNLTVIDSASYSFANLFGGNNNTLHNCRSRGAVDGAYSGDWLKRDVNGVNTINTAPSVRFEDSVNGGDVNITIRNRYALDTSLDETASVIFQFDNLSETAVDAAQILAGKQEDFGSTGERSAYLAFLTNADNSGLVERVRITKDGKVGIGETTPLSALHVNGAVTQTETASVPPDALTSSGAMRQYLKGDKWVVEFNDGGTMRYRTMDLTGTNVTWVHSTTPP